MMTAARTRFLLSAALALGLAACTPGGRASDLKSVEKEIMKNGQYWQRKDTSSAIYMQGPKAQQMLNRDISRCVTELGELDRLGQINAGFPADRKDTDTTGDADRKELMGHDVPERDGALLNEQSQYADFESCMVAKGWERVAYVPYAAAERGADAYIANHAGLQSRTKNESRGTAKEKTGPYDKLND